MSNNSNRSKINFIIDVLLFVTLLAIAGIGLLIKYVLLPGFVRDNIYGKDVDLYFMGLNRHEWGDIHLIISGFLILLLILHVFYHWKMVVVMFKKTIPKKSIQIISVAGLLIIIFVFGISWIFLEPEVNAKQDRQISGTIEIMHENERIVPENVASQEKRHRRKKHDKLEIEVYGYSTLNEIAERYEISVEELASFIDVPVDYADVRIGRLRKKYGFKMHDLRAYIDSCIDS
jgi:glucan phosphoethanolaminetransferase (alkaline phosphatase superfamily)